MAGMETLAEHGVGHHLTFIQGQHNEEQAHTQFQDFLWKRVGLNKKKAAIAAASMPKLPEDMVIEVRACVHACACEIRRVMHACACVRMRV